MDTPWWAKVLILLIVLGIMTFFVYAVCQDRQSANERMRACAWAGYGQPVFIADRWFCIRGMEGGGIEAMPVWPGILLDYRAKREVQ